MMYPYLVDPLPWQRGRDPPLRSASAAGVLSTADMRSAANFRMHSPSAARQAAIFSSFTAAASASSASASLSVAIAGDGRSVTWGAPGAIRFFGGSAFACSALLPVLLVFG
jgi:hypothetical protein